MDTLSSKISATLSVAASGAIGCLAWLTNTALIPIALLFPPLTFAQPSRTRATLVAMSYYGVSSLPVVQISTKYFGQGDGLTGILPWMTASGILAAPWIILWDRNLDQMWWRLPVALLLVTIPPIGIIGWASPLIAAGSIFPGFGWLGLLLIVIGMVAPGRSLRLTAALVLLSFVANISYKGPRPIESSWLGADTRFGNIYDSNNPNAEFSIAESIQRIALATNRRVIVFPEMVLRRWSEGADLFWQPTFDALRERGSTVVFGAAFASPASVNEYRNAAVIRGADHASISPEFEALWNRIKPKTTYRVEFSTDELVFVTSRAVRKMPQIQAATVSFVTATIGVKQAGVEATAIAASTEEVEYQGPLPDILTYLQNETELTRSTLVRILKESERLSDFFVNPQKFMDAVAGIVKNELHRLLIDGIKYERIQGTGPDAEWDMMLIRDGEMINYLNALQVDKSVHEYVVYDSEIEREFARRLDERQDIKLFVKLPRDFKVETPVGAYNPDWAIVKHQEETLYLVRETKGTADFLKLRNSEADKVRCGQRHFAAIGVPFAIAVSADEV